MKYLIDKSEWEGTDRQIRLKDRSVPAAGPKHWMPAAGEGIGMIYDKPSGEIPENADYIVCAKHRYAICPMEKAGLLRATLGWIRVHNKDGMIGYVAVMKKRRWPLAVLAVPAAWAASTAFLYFVPADSPLIPAKFLTQVKAQIDNPGAKAVIGQYASYQSIDDQVWDADSMTQDVMLVLPDTVNTSGIDGEEITYPNPVYAAPHIYVDLNSDGSFDDDECVFNPIAMNPDGSVADLGQMLKPGNMIDKIELTKPLTAGDYDAQLIWTGIRSDTQEMANPMLFRFHLKVV